MRFSTPVADSLPRLASSPLSLLPSTTTHSQRPRRTRALVPTALATSSARQLSTARTPGLLGNRHPGSRTPERAVVSVCSVAVAAAAGSGGGGGAADSSSSKRRKKRRKKKKKEKMTTTPMTSNPTPPPAAAEPAAHQSATTEASGAMQVVFVATEVAPWSKVGGLGDVMAALPAALASR